MCRRRSATAGIALAVSLLAANFSFAQTTLRYKFTKGDKLQYLLEQKTATKLTAQVFKAESTVKQTVDMSWTVKAADADKATITVKFERLRSALISPKEKWTFDSKEGKEAEGPAGKAMKVMAGLEFDMNVDARGKVSGVKLAAKSAEAVKTLGATAEMAAMSAAMSAPELEKTMNQALMSFPSDALKPGATWKQEFTNTAEFGTVKTEKALEFKGVKQQGGNTLAEIALKPTVSVTPGEKVKVTLKEQKGEGTAYFNPGSGRLTELSETQSMVLNIGFRGQDLTYEYRQSLSMKLQ